MFQIAEVVETKTAFKPNQRDDDGDILPLGSIQVRIGGDISLLGQVRNLYARPASFNRRIPLIGEQVLVMRAPVHDKTSRVFKSHDYLYFNPYNSTDDLVLHQFPKLWSRSKHAKGGKSGPRLSDREVPGYTFPKTPRKTENIQIFEGDEIIEGRFGQSIRFSSTIEGNTSVYSKKPSWKGGMNTDPIMIMRIKKPSTPGNYKFNFNLKNNPKANQYTIEDIGKDDASVYLTSTQMLSNFRAGFMRNKDAARASSWKSSSQIILDAGRIVINAKKDKALLISKLETIVTGEKVLLQSKKYKVYLDDLMDYINDVVKELWKLTAGQAQFSTSTGPTLTATNVTQVTKLHKQQFNQKFKIP